MVSIPVVEEGAIAETRPGTAGVLQGFAARAENAPLAVLIIDYGYSQPTSGDTVQAVKQHRFAGLFEAPGEADLTAHVDFSASIQQAKELNLTAYGPMPMGEWLLRLGLEAGCISSCAAPPRNRPWNCAAVLPGSWTRPRWAHFLRPLS